MGSPSRVIACDVCVVGGGPAGATASRRLAQLGLDVCVVDRGRWPRPHGGESLPPSILQLLEQTGVRDRVESAGFRRSNRALVRWGAGHAVAKDADGERGFVVDRERFDAVLLEAARDAGVRVRQPAAVVRVESADTSAVACLDDGTRIRARFLVDAAGRSGVLARARARTRPPTAALYASWLVPAVDDDDTRVEAGESEWYWGALLPRGEFNAAVFLDARRCRGLTRATREGLYRDLILRSTLLARCVRGRLLGRVQVCDASPFVDAQPVADATIKIGEAAFAVDPVSSQGVQIAMRSALHAAAVVHTTLRCQERAALARRFYRERIAETAAHHAMLASDAYATARVERSHEFWSARALARRRHPAFAPRRDVVPDAVVLSPIARLETLPVLDGDLIADGVALAHPNLEREVAFLGGVPVAPLVRAASVPRRRDELLSVWTRHAPPPMCRQILDWLWQRGVLEEAR